MTEQQFLQPSIYRFLVLRFRAPRVLRTTPVCSRLPIRPDLYFPYPRVVMETAQLQLVLNVIALTGVSSLASFSYLRWRDRKLAQEREAEAAQKQRAPSVVVERSAPSPSPQCASPAATTEALPELDIR